MSTTPRGDSSALEPGDGVGKALGSGPITPVALRSALQNPDKTFPVQTGLIASDATGTRWLTVGGRRFEFQGNAFEYAKFDASKVVPKPDSFFAGLVAGPPIAWSDPGSS